MPATRSFVDWLEAQVSGVASRTALSRADAFAVWALMYVHEGLEESEALECCDTLDAGHGDGGIDGKCDDEDNELFCLSQSKFPEDPLGTSIGMEKNLRDLPATVAAMIAGSPAGLPPKREVICDDVREACDRGRTIVLEYFLAGQVPDRTREELDRLVATIPGAEVVVYSLEDLHDIYVSRELQTDLAGENVRFPLAASGQLIPISLCPTGVDSAVCVALDARGLGVSARPLGSRLFSANVRYELSKTNRYNVQMKSTLKDDPTSFWFYNNGITIVCDDWAIGTAGDAVEITNPQVVNGCQTVNAIVSTRNSLESGDALVMARVIKKAGTPEGATKTLQIAEYTNSQTHVKAADLRANEELQAKFQTKFTLVPGPYFYERKRGEWDQLSNDQRRLVTTARRVTMANIGQRYRAWSGKPAEAITDKGQIFENRAVHAQVYKLDIDAHVYLLAHEVFVYFDSILATRNRSFLSGLGVLTETDIPRLERAKKYFASHATVLAKALVERQFGPIDSNNAAEFRAYFSRDDVREQLVKYIGNVFHQFLQAHPAGSADAKKLLANEATSTQELRDSLDSTLSMLPSGVSPLPTQTPKPPV